MRKYSIFIWLISLFCMVSCLEDTSAYFSQQKENVKVDDVENEKGENEDGTEVLPEGELVPGIHLVKLNVAQPDGTITERRFKYFMPISIDENRPISLIFEFHGSYSIEPGVEAPDPLAGISTSNYLCQHAIKENCVICFPAGTAEYQDDGNGAVNWQYSDKHLLFFDSMVDYFKSRTPGIDPNRIYSTGQSSGAIFSFVLAFYRSNVVAAITPRAGQMSLEGESVMPERAVPVRVFAGEEDETVAHSAVISNMTAWAERIGGYFASDMILTEDSFEIEGYKKVDTRIWSGGKADFQIFTLKEEGHGISGSYCLPYMWEFMSSHTLNNSVENLYLNYSLKEIVAQCGEPITFQVNYTEGASFTISNPKGWNLKKEGHVVSLTGPKDFYADVERDGSIEMTVSLNGKTVQKSIPLKLIPPKNYFEVGDVFYNNDFQPVGVVCWVNQANIREAKIVNIDEQANKWYLGSGDGLGVSVTTPSKTDGEANTQKMAKANAALSEPISAKNSLVIWASQYRYQSVGDWYLPAVGELEAMAPYIDKINGTIQELGGTLLKPAYSGDFTLYSSTTEVKEGASTKTFYRYNFTKREIEEQTSRDASDYIGFTQGRAFKKVTK